MPETQARALLVHTDLVRLMLLARGLERRAMRSRSASGSRLGSPRGRGCEAMAVGAAAALGTTDRLFASDRYLAAHLVRGLAPEDYLLRCLGGQASPAGDPRSVGYASPGSELVDLAAGAALAEQLSGRGGVTMALVTGAAVAGGDYDEALRAAASRRLPLVLAVEGAASPAHATSLLEVDARDVEAVANVARAGVGRARTGDGPVVLLCLAKPRVDEATGPERPSDPINRELRRLACNEATRPMIRRIREDVSTRIQEAERRARLLRVGAPGLEANL